jgi:hypothetical protein
MEYYILQLSDILDEYYEDSWFEHMDREVTGEIFGNYDNFSVRLRDYVERHGGVLYDNIFDAFLDEEYGVCDWEMGEW